MYFSSVVLVNFRNMGRSGAAKNKQLRENRQDLVQNLLAAAASRAWRGIGKTASSRFVCKHFLPVCKLKFTPISTGVRGGAEGDSIQL